jgi:hypothetical protein
MFNIAELKRAVNIQKRAYLLLKWMNTAMVKGFITTDTAHKYTTASEVAFEWIERHYENLPINARPERNDTDELSAYANMLSTYMLTSFNIEEEPIKLTTIGCKCPMCIAFASSSHLRLKKLTSEDKKRAKKLKINYLKKLALHCEKSLDDNLAREIAENPNYKETLAMATYADQLIQRVRGHIEGPALLALWREFAWDVKGSPKKHFDLNESDILKCEQDLINIIPG